jgi:hypothetical protein
MKWRQVFKIPCKEACIYYKMVASLGHPHAKIGLAELYAAEIGLQKAQNFL